MKPDRDYRTCGWAKEGTTYCALHKGPVDEAHCYHCGTWGKYFVNRMELAHDNSRGTGRGTEAKDSPVLRGVT